MGCGKPASTWAERCAEVIQVSLDDVGELSIPAFKVTLSRVPYVGETLYWDGPQQGYKVEAVEQVINPKAVVARIQVRKQ